MEVALERKQKFDDRMIGAFYDQNGKFTYYTLELDEAHAIPTGRYKLELHWSPERQGLVVFVMNVPDRDAIEIHVGNSPLDSRGCILLGKSFDPVSKRLVSSILAVQSFYEWFAIQKEDVFLNIT